MRPSKKWFKRSIIPVLALAVLGTYLALPLSVVNAEEKILGQLEYDSIVLEGSHSAYSNNPVQYFSTVNVVPDAGKKVAKVVLRNKATKEVVRELPIASGNAYTLGNISGEKIPVTHEVADIWDGTWNWWRDSTNPNVWMYDLDDRYYFLQDEVYDQPQPNAKRKVLPQPSDTNAPLPSFAGAEEVSDGNIGWAESTKSLPGTIYGDNQAFDVSKLTNVTASYQYYYDSESVRPYISPSNILAVETKSVDLPDLRLTFRYKAKFSEVHTRTAFGSQGLINEYHTAWKVSLSTEVYKYPQLEIVYYQEPAGGGSPSPGASSTPTPTPTPTPDKEKIVAQFEIEEPVIEYGEYNWAKPIGSSVTGGGQKLKEYVWTISQNGNTETQTSTTVLTMGGFPAYPRWLTTGTVSVSLKVVSTSGNSASVGPKTFQIITPASCTSYNPNLDFKIGFVDHGNRGAWESITTAVVGDYLDVQELARRPDDDPPPSGSYPKTVISWDWKNAIKSSAWLKKYYENYQPNEIYEEYYSFPYNMIFTNDDLGSHSITATKSDACGNSSSRTASVVVVPPNPIAVIKGQSTVKEARPLTEPFDSSSSYSPVKGRGINHSRDEWGNKQTVYYTPGTEIITLQVWDNGGLPSLEEARHTLTVLPDFPPVAIGKAPSKAIRGSPITIKDASYSPDGDELKPTELWEQYDSNNDGVYDNESLVSLTLENGKLSRHYTKVGKYRYKIRAVEVSPLEKESTSYFYVEVVDLAPSVFYTLKGTDFNPPASVTDYYPSSQIANDFTWGSYSFNAQKNYSYNSQEDAIETGKATWTLQSAPSYSGLEVKYNSYYCDNTWYCLGGPSEFIMPTIFGNNGYTTGFVDPYSKLTDAKRYGTTAKHHSYANSINREEDLVWYNWNEYSSWNSSYTYYDDIYKISDIQRALDTGTPVTPIQTREVTVKNKEDYDKLPIPDKYRIPPTKTDLDISKYIPVTYKGPYGTSSYNIASVFASDRANNSYFYDLDSKGNYYYAEGYFRKKGLTGNVLWSMPINLGYSHQIPNDVPTISYISPDNSLLILRSKLYLWFVDNNTGGIIKTLDGKGGIFNGNRLVYYTHQDSGERISGDRVFDYYLNFYDIKTGITTRSGAPFYRYVEKRDDNGDILPPPPVTMLKTNDGNFIVFGGYLDRSPPYAYRELMSISVYSFTGQLLTDIRPKDLYARANPEKITFTGDGDMVVHLFSSGSDSSTSSYYLTIRSQPENAILTEYFGQLYNNSIKMRDGEIVEKLKINFDNFSSNVSAGIAARIQDNENMYRFEVTPETSRLVKIQNGQRTVLASQPYSLNWREYYTLKLKISGERIQGFINGVPLLSATDGSFYEGYFGPFSGIPYSLIKDFSVTKSYSNEGKVENAVIVDSDVEVTSDYSDSEGDPEIPQLREWKYVHSNVNKFLDTGDGKSGLSSLHGRVVSAVFPKFDKVGEYELSYRVPDDPSPEGYQYPKSEFSSYREYSDSYVNKIIVHRRPISLFTLTVNSSGWIEWHDTSYDPDRWLSPTNFSAESPYYSSNRGVFGRKYKYTTPSGITIEGKLTRPTESGVYIASEAVMDEYGAWSDWYDQQITATIVLPPNKAPVVDFESPRYVYRDDLNQLINKSMDPDGDPMIFKWSIMKPPYTSGLSNFEHPQFRIIDRGLGKDAVSPNWFITLEATDSKGETGSKTKSLTVLNHIPTTAIYGQQEVLIRQTHSYTSGGADLDSEDSGHLSYYWKVTEPDGTETDYSGSSTLSLTFNKGGTYKLEHWVIDPVGDSSNIAQLLVSVDDNKPPVPGFTITPNPAYRGETVGIVSTASDPDGIIARHDYWITGPDGLEQHVTTEADWSRTYSVLGDYTIRQRVEDNKGALAETSQVLHIINRPPTVELTTPSGSDAEHPSVNIPPFKAEWTYEDEDGDPQASYTFAIYEYPSGVWKAGTTGTGITSYFNVPTGILQGGVTYYATVTVSDGYDTTTSQPKYFILNRPPVADFIWSPSPVYEGDTVKLTNKSYDPDGDSFTSEWMVKAPDSSTKSYDTTDVSVRWTQVGAYTVTLTVTDSYGDSGTVTKTIQVLPLGISGFVGHTETWNNNRAKFNAKQEREETRIHRNDDEFWAGEAFILTADTTNTGTSTYAVSVDVIAEGDPIPHDWAWYHLYTEMEPEDGRVKWKARMNSPDPDRGIKMEQLSDGPLDFTFEVTYSNGTVKQDVVRIYMRNKWTEYWQVHRAW